MARKIPRDSLPIDWAHNPYVAFHGDASVVQSGYWHAPLKLPITANRRVCLPLARIYAERKYLEQFESAAFLEALDQPAATLRGGVLFTGAFWHWHYLIDGLANLTAGLFERHRTLFVDDDLAADQVEFLSDYVALLTPHPVAIERIAAATYALEDVCVPVNGRTADKIARLRGVLASGPDEVPSGARAPARIYVSRRHAATRRLRNEDALAGALAAELGFEVVDNETLSLREQVRRYRHAEVIAGPHGAGLANLVFARAPRALVECYHSYRQGFYEDLARCVGASWLALEGEPVADEAAGERKDNRDFTLAVTPAVSRIRTLIGA